jgi:ubiquinol-cytochrome c reductase cytochrome b subunit
MQSLLNWLDHRTGYKEFLHEALYENVPGGSRWRYVWGSTLAFAFTVQVITGLFLWMFYSPSAQTAWESIYFLQYQVAGGAFLRGLHHYMAQLMVVLMAIHLFQVVIDGAYKAPREINFWLGLILLQIVLGLALTGYLLPWDQKGYWATQVATKIMGIVPVVGPDLQRLVIGGNEYGHHTLTRFFALHAGVLPAALVLFLVLHVALFRRHGLTAKIKPGRADQMFWPDQVLKDAVACLAVLLLVSFLAWRFPAELGAPADPSDSYDSARPEWYFLFLFQFLKFFHGEAGERIGAIYIPGLLMGVLFLMPFIAKLKFGHKLNVAFLFVVLAGAAVLTGLAVQEDANKPEYAAAVKQAHADAERSIELASEGIPDTALALVRGDAKIQGAKLFRRHCASCHNYVDSTGEGIELQRELTFQPGPDGKVPADALPEPTGAPNLYGFASRQWLTGFLNPEKIAEAHYDKKAPVDSKEKRFITDAPYFGNTAHRDGDMVAFVRDELKDLDEEGKKKLNSIIVALSAQAKLKSQIDLDAHAERTGVLAAGNAQMAEAIDSQACTDCHKFGDIDNEGGAPDLTGYGSREWLLAFIGDPAHARFYGENNDRMPPFYDSPDAPAQNLLDQDSIQMIVDWLRGEWYEPPTK